MEIKKIRPCFAVEDIYKTIIFYRKLGFELEYAVPESEKKAVKEVNQDGAYIFAMMKKDGVALMFERIDILVEEVPYFRYIPMGASVSFYMVIEKIDDFYKKIKDKVEVIEELKEKYYGMKEFYIKDCNGYVLCFGENIKT